MIRFRRSSLLLAAVMIIGCSCVVRAESTESACNSRFDPGDEDFDGYTTCVRSALKEDADAYASVLVLPSFEPEYAVSVVRDSKRAQWSVRYAIAERSIWNRWVERYRAGHAAAGNVDVCKAAVRVISYPIAADLSDRILSAWKRMVDVPASSMRDSAGIDGTTFIFSAAGKRAHTWSPQCGVPQLAVETAEGLMAAAGAESAATRDSALMQISVSLRSLEQLLPTLSGASAP